MLVWLIWSPQDLDVEDHLQTTVAPQAADPGATDLGKTNIIVSNYGRTRAHTRHTCSDTHMHRHTRAPPPPPKTFHKSVLASTTASYSSFQSCLDGRPQCTAGPEGVLLLSRDSTKSFLLGNCALTVQPSQVSRTYLKHDSNALSMWLNADVSAH